jgi:hypothetical protein
MSFIDQELMHLASLYGYKFICSHEIMGKNIYILEIKDEFSGKDEVFEFVILARKSEDDRRYSLIIQFPDKIAK